MFDSPRIFNKKVEPDKAMLTGEALSTEIYQGDILFAKEEGLFVGDSDAGTLKDWYQNKMIVPDDERVDNIIFIDTETSHLNGFIVSIAIIGFSLVNKKQTFSFYKEINPQVKIDPEATAVHGITDEKVMNAPIFSDIFQEVDSILREADLIQAFNAIYDVATLIREYDRLGIKPPSMPYIDTMKRLKIQVDAKNTLGRLKDPKLSEAASFFGITFEESTLHNALYDTDILVKVFEAAINGY